MNLINKISPPFLRKLDKHLRVNHTWIWTTKIHIHLYLGILLSALFALVGLMYHVGIKDVPTMNAQDTLFIILFIPATAFAIYIVYNMSLFNTDKSAAYRFKYQGVFLFLIYFFSFCLPLVIPYSAGLVLNARVANLVEDHQFEQDKDQYNKGLAFFSISIYDYNYYPSDSIYLASKNKRENDDNYIFEENQIASWERMKDSIFWHRGTYAENRPKLYYHHTKDWSGSRTYYYSRNRVRRSYLSYQQAENDTAFFAFIQHINLVHDAKTATQHVAGMAALINKYNEGYILDQKKAVDGYLHNDYNPPSFPGNHMELALDNVERNITGVFVAKTKDVNTWSLGVFSALSMFIFCFTLLFQVYKNVHWRQLLLAMGIWAILITLNIILEIADRFHGKIVIATAVYLPFMLILVTIAAFSVKKFNWILNQATIFLSAILPFYPIIVLFYLDHSFHIFTISYFDKYQEYSINSSGYKELVYNEAYHDLISTIWQCTFWGGIFSYVLIWNSYLKSLYLKLWSLPKNK